jgi:hypothetical protein
VHLIQVPIHLQRVCPQPRPFLVPLAQARPFLVGLSLQDRERVFPLPPLAVAVDIRQYPMAPQEDPEDPDPLQEEEAVEDHR